MARNCVASRLGLQEAKCASCDTFDFHNGTRTRKHGKSIGRGREEEELGKREEQRRASAYVKENALPQLEDGCEFKNCSAFRSGQRSQAEHLVLLRLLQKCQARKPTQILNIERGRNTPGFDSYPGDQQLIVTVGQPGKQLSRGSDA